MWKKILLLIILVSISVIVGFIQGKKINFNSKYTVGEALDSLNGVKVYFNGGVNNVTERNIVDGYNVGLKYQCVEFVKRYYFKVYNHKMPDTYGHAKSFFNDNVKDGQLNKERALKQFVNPSKSRPKVGDLVVMSGTIFNRFGHVCIVSKIGDNSLEVIQQNSGCFGSTRVVFQLSHNGMKWFVENNRIKGWLRK